MTDSVWITSYVNNDDYEILHVSSSEEKARQWLDGVKVSVGKRESRIFASGAIIFAEMECYPFLYGRGNTEEEARAELARFLVIHIEIREFKVDD